MSMRKIFTVVKATAVTMVAVMMVAGASLAQEKKVTIGVSLASDTNPFYIAVKEGIQKKAKEMGVEAIYVTANEDVSKQINGIQDLVARGVSAILVSPIDTVALAGAYQMAGMANIPVISVVRFVNSPYQKLEVTFDWKSIGVKIADRMAKEVNEEGKVAVLAGPPGAKLFVDLAAGFREGLAKYPKMKIVFEKEIGVNREAGLKQAEDALTAHNDLVAIYGANDEIALGAAQAVAAAGRTGKVQIAGLNGVPPAIQAVKNGQLLLTYDLNPPGWGAAGFEAAVNFARGKPVNKDDVKLEAYLIDRSNVDQFIKK